MLYNSTENNKEVVSAAQAIAQGISKDGGLFVPQELPKYTEETFKSLLGLSYNERAKIVFSDFLTDFTEEEIADCVDKAYTVEKFGSECPAPLTKSTLWNYGMVQHVHLRIWHFRFFHIS